MNRSEAIEIAGKCESFLNIPALYCEQIEKDLMENNYKEVIWFIIGRKEEIDKKKQQELERYKNIIDEAIKELETLLPLCIMPNNTLIHATEKAKVIEKAINTLQGKSDE